MQQKGSYNVSHLDQKEEELLRLKSQAEKLYGLESKLLKEWSGLKSNHRVLEVGCGPGFITPLLCELAFEGSVTACDTNIEFVDICKKQQMKIPQYGFKAVCTDGTSLPVEELSQDFTYLRFVLQHVPEKNILLKQVYNSLKVDGIVCVLDSDDGLNLHYPEDPFINDLIKNAQSIQSSKGGDRFIGRKVSEMLNREGFEKIQSRVLSFSNSELPFPFLANVALGFKAALCGRKKELEKWISDNESNVNQGKLFFTAGVVLTIAKRGSDK